MVRDYELLYIVRPDLDDEATRGAVSGVQTLIETNGGAISRTVPWGRRKLAYEIKKFRDGQYVIVELKIDGGKITEMDRALKISDAVIRHMFVVASTTIPMSENVLQEREEGDGAAPRATESVSVLDIEPEIEEFVVPALEEGDE